MIDSALIYLFTLALLVAVVSFIQLKTQHKLFEYIPVVVLIYATSMLLALLGIFEPNKEISEIYKVTKTNLLPAMLFLMLLEVDFKHLFQLAKPLLIAYFLALGSFVFAFIVAVKFFHFVVNSPNDTLWFMLLLFVMPFAKVFNKFTKSAEKLAYLDKIGCACSMGAKRYWLIIVLALSASLLSQVFAVKFFIFDTTMGIILFSTLLGVAGSFTKLRFINGTSEVATTMLYILIALIGSRVVIENFSGFGMYVWAGVMILVIHTLIMLVGAKIFKLDLFSISVASLASIGGVASAPILAATYNKSLVGIGVVMAIMGYLIVGNILAFFS